MDEEIIGTIKMFSGNFAPKGYLFCNGQTLSIAQNQALFSIIGTMYGGDGRTTFCLPNLNSSIPLGVSNSPSEVITSLGQNGKIVASSHGTHSTLKTLGINYIICVNGLYPIRND